ncbi:MAG: hypothetical protein HY863_07305 [Chloroflexi bacterium]|nr:hypothetical protein [Chloroflexota bacterium]
MKRIIVVLSVLLGACSQAAVVDSTQTVTPHIATATSQATGSPPVVLTSLPDVLPSLSTLQPGPVTLVALGDSLTAGDGDDSGRGGYPGRILVVCSISNLT